MLNTTCPQCNSPFGRKLSIIYEEGLTLTKSNNNSTSHTNTILKTKITTKGSSAGLHQTELSKSVAPPLISNEILVSKASATAGIFGLIAFIIGCIFGSIIGYNFLTKILFSMVLGVILLVIVFNSMNKEPTTQEIESHEAKIAPSIKALEDWNNTYMCMACGNRFIPKKLSEDEAITQN